MTVMMPPPGLRLEVPAVAAATAKAAGLAGDPQEGQATFPYGFLIHWIIDDLLGTNIFKNGSLLVGLLY